jgi:hypothetical protein
LAAVHRCPFACGGFGASQLNVGKRSAILIRASFFKRIPDRPSGSQRVTAIKSARFWAEMELW